MRLSVIVPVYNMAADDKLRYCMNSLVHQTITDYEIIAVDDCSTDESYAILQEFEREYKGLVRALRGDRNRKQGGAKNLGLEASTGDWIGFIDADDWVTKDYYEKLFALADETGADMVGCDYHLTAEHSDVIGQVVPNNRMEQTGPLNTEKYRSLILDSGSLVVKIYRREIIMGCDSRFPEDMFYEDNALANTWMLRAHYFAYLPEPLYSYYQHAESTVHTISIDRLKDRMEAGRIMLREAKKYGYYEEYLPELMYQFTVLFYVNTLFSAMPDRKLKGKYQFTKALFTEMIETFPEFAKNQYYIERTGDEEKRLIAMQQKSQLKFYLYYKLLWTVRNFRKKLRAIREKK